VGFYKTVGDLMKYLLAASRVYAFPETRLARARKGEPECRYLPRLM
jgi:hypothetical protein